MYLERALGLTSSKSGRFKTETGDEPKSEGMMSNQGIDSLMNKTNMLKILNAKVVSILTCSLSAGMAEREP